MSKNELSKAYLKEGVHGIAPCHRFRALGIAGVQLETGHDVVEVVRLEVVGAHGAKKSRQPASA